ncbi:hypothetical protein Poly21_43790 [Allorhodopirellula heiligendammensis]|uniref:Uncharacterized protein n=1 Tax=Allorhodopirellula heiligendammensis TaxID=2714739 RepID=A0A5C6BE58_9BACT|nr:hypothetical protein Poly21_43790 [Allorhodopirellula heiligendammensis]
MIRLFIVSAVTLTLGILIPGCGSSENRTIETQGELWDERAAFYADESNFSNEESVSIDK